jgi:hypothetical protein
MTSGPRHLQTCRPRKLEQQSVNTFPDEIPLSDEVIAQLLEETDDMVEAGYNASAEEATSEDDSDREAQSFQAEEENFGQTVLAWQQRAEEVLRLLDRISEKLEVLKEHRRRHHEQLEALKRLVYGSGERSDWSDEDLGNESNFGDHPRNDDGSFPNDDSTPEEDSSFEHVSADEDSPFEEVSGEEDSSFEDVSP